MDNSSDNEINSQFNEEPEEFDGLSLTISVQSMKTCASNSSKDSIFCRICHQNETSDTEKPDLISPCNCMGSMANVHQHCLQRWASIASTSSCDICGFNYSCRKKYPSFLKWIRQVMASKEFTVELLITVLMLISTPLIIAATVLSSLVRYSEEMAFKPLVYSLWTITIFSWILYSVMLYCTVRFLHKSFTDWRDKNTTIELVWTENSHQNNIENYI